MHRFLSNEWMMRFAGASSKILLVSINNLPIDLHAKARLVGQRHPSLRINRRDFRDDIVEVLGDHRRRVLWKERGQFEPLRWQVDSRTSVLATAVWLVVAIAGLVLFFGRSQDLDSGMRVIAAAAGLATGVIYYALGVSLKVDRYRWVGAVAGLLSLGMMPLPISAAAAWLIFSAIWGLSLLIAGIIAFRHTLANVKKGEA